MERCGRVDPAVGGSILWSAITNGAAFGTDHFTRTAVARSNIFVNKAKETRYFTRTSTLTAPA